MNLDNKTRKGRNDVDQTHVKEFDMARIKRRYTLNGVEIWVTGESEQAVADSYADLKYSMHSGVVRPSAKHNFRSFSQDNWRYISQTVSVNTNLDYERYMKNQILPHFGEMNVEDITWRDVQDFYDKHRAYAFSTVHKWRIVLSRVLQIAVGDGIIPIDPTKDKRLSHSKRRRQRPVPSEKTYKMLLSDIKRLKRVYERLYMALVGYTGLRKSEVLALRWTDVHFDENTLHITHSVDLQRTTKKRPGVLKAPKSEAGVRVVPMVEPLRNLLLENRHDHEFVVTNPDDGRPVHSASEFDTLWRRIRAQIDVGPYTSHSYRHAMATALLTNGVDIKTTQAIIGHSQPSTTLNIYSHAVPNKIREAGYIFTDKMTT